MAIIKLVKGDEYLPKYDGWYYYTEQKVVESWAKSGVGNPGYRLTSYGAREVVPWSAMWLWHPDVPDEPERNEFGVICP